MTCFLQFTAYSTASTVTYSLKLVSFSIRSSNLQRPWSFVTERLISCNKSPREAKEKPSDPDPSRPYVRSRRRPRSHNSAHIRGQLIHPEHRRKKKNKNRESYAAAGSGAAATTAFFFGVAAFLVTAFLVPAAFFAGAGLAGPLVIRPDLVLPMTFSWSTTAGAYSKG